MQRYLFGRRSGVGGSAPHLKSVEVTASYADGLAMRPDPRGSRRISGLSIGDNVLERERERERERES